MGNEKVPKYLNQKNLFIGSEVLFLEGQISQKLGKNEEAIQKLNSALDMGIAVYGKRHSKLIPIVRALIRLKQGD